VLWHFGQVVAMLVLPSLTGVSFLVLLRHRNEPLVVAAVRSVVSHLQRRAGDVEAALFFADVLVQCAFILDFPSAAPTLQIAL
jgi:hypothetical protein